MTMKKIAPLIVLMLLCAGGARAGPVRTSPSEDASGWDRRPHQGQTATSRTPPDGPSPHPGHGSSGGRLRMDHRPRPGQRRRRGRLRMTIAASGTTVLWRRVRAGYHRRRSKPDETFRRRCRRDGTRPDASSTEPLSRRCGRWSIRRRLDGALSRTAAGWSIRRRLQHEPLSRMRPMVPSGGVLDVAVCPDCGRRSSPTRPRIVMSDWASTGAAAHREHQNDQRCDLFHRHIPQKATIVAVKSDIENSTDGRVPMGSPPPRWADRTYR